MAVDFARIHLLTPSLGTIPEGLVRIFMEGQEEWLEPCGSALVVLAKLLIAGSCVALVWGAFIRFGGHGVTRDNSWPEGATVAAVVFSCLSLAFWLAGKLSIFMGRKMRERGLKLP